MSRVGLLRVLGIMNGDGGAVALLPFADDFERADGGLGSSWDAPTYIIVSDQVTNEPTNEPDLFDPGKGTFDSGTGSWVAAAGGAITNESGVLKVAVSSGDTGGTLLLADSADLSANLVTGGWYEMQYDAYRVTGNALFFYTKWEYELLPHCKQQRTATNPQVGFYREIHISYAVTDRYGGGT